MLPRSGLTDATIRPNAAKYAIWKADAASNFSRLLEYMDDPGASSPIDAVNDELSTRGAAWSFLRYSVDRAFTSDAGVWSRFTNSIQTGLNTMADGLLTDPRPYLADFTLANYISDLGISSDPRFKHKSWNYRDIFSNTFGSRATGVFVPNGFYPIKLTGLPDGVAKSTGVKGGIPRATSDSPCRPQRKHSSPSPRCRARRTRRSSSTRCERNDVSERGGLAREHGRAGGDLRVAARFRWRLAQCPHDLERAR